MVLVVDRLGVADVIFEKVGPVTPLLLMHQILFLTKYNSTSATTSGFPSDQSLKFLLLTLQSKWKCASSLYWSSRVPVKEDITKMSSRFPVQ